MHCASPLLTPVRSLQSRPLCLLGWGRQHSTVATWIGHGFISCPEPSTSTDSHAGSLSGPLTPHAERTLVVQAVEIKLKKKVFGETLSEL